MAMEGQRMSLHYFIKAIFSSLPILTDRVVHFPLNKTIVSTPSDGGHKRRMSKTHCSWLCELSFRFATHQLTHKEIEKERDVRLKNTRPNYLNHMPTLSHPIKYCQKSMRDGGIEEPGQSRLWIGNWRRGAVVLRWGGLAFWIPILNSKAFVRKLWPMWLSRRPHDHDQVILGSQCVNAWSIV